MQGLGKAFHLEMRHLTERRVRFLSHFIIPVIITIILGQAGGTTCSFCPSGGTKNTYFNSYAPLIFSTSMVFIATQLMVLRIVGERAPYGPLDRDMLAISRSGMYLGKVLAGLVVVSLQSVIFVIVGMELYSMSMSGNPYLFLSLLVMISIVGLCLGLLFSAVSKTKEQAVQLVPFIVLIFLVFSGDLILIKDMPRDIGNLATNSPLTLANEGLRKIMLGGSDFQDLSSRITKLFLWIAMIFLLGLIKFTSEKK